MPIPRTREDLLQSVSTEFTKLDAELRDAELALANVVCVDDWTVKDLLAVRLWWTQHVLNWIDLGRKGKTPVTPAKGYRWKETPRLNNDTVARSKDKSWSSICTQLRRQYTRLLKTIDSLNDRELLQTGIYAWAGSYPLARWLSINTARQYHTARTYVRRAKKELKKGKDALAT